MFSSYSGVRLEINNKNITGKSPNTWKIKTFLMSHRGNFKSNKNNYTELNENKNIAYQKCEIQLKQ